MQFKLILLVRLFLQLIQNRRRLFAIQKKTSPEHEVKLARANVLNPPILSELR